MKLVPLLQICYTSYEANPAWPSTWNLHKAAGGGKGEEGQLCSWGTDYNCLCPTVFWHDSFVFAWLHVPLLKYSQLVLPLICSWKYYNCSTSQPSTWAWKEEHWNMMNVCFLAISTSKQTTIYILSSYHFNWWSCALNFLHQVSALDQDVIEIDPDTKEMLKLLVSTGFCSFEMLTKLCAQATFGTQPYSHYLSNHFSG